MATRSTFAALGLLILAAPALAQVPATSGHRLQWDQNDADAPSLTYLLGVNGATPTPMAGTVTCTPVNGPIHECQIGVSDLGLTQGQYTITVQARRIVEGLNFDSAESSALTVVRAELPADATNLVIIVEAP